jgi:hypothetical protein
MPGSQFAFSLPPAFARGLRRAREREQHAGERWV